MDAFDLGLAARRQGLPRFSPLRGVDAYDWLMGWDCADVAASAA